MLASIPKSVLRGVRITKPCLVQKAQFSKSKITVFQSNKLVQVAEFKKSFYSTETLTTQNSSDEQHQEQDEKPKRHVPYIVNNKWRNYFYGLLIGLGAGTFLYYDEFFFPRFLENEVLQKNLNSDDPSERENAYWNVTTIVELAVRTGGLATVDKDELVRTLVKGTKENYEGVQVQALESLIQLFGQKEICTNPEYLKLIPWKYLLTEFYNKEFTVPKTFELLALTCFYEPNAKFILNNEDCVACLKKMLNSKYLDVRTRAAHAVALLSRNEEVRTQMYDFVPIMYNRWHYFPPGFSRNYLTEAIQNITDSQPTDAKLKKKLEEIKKPIQPDEWNGIQEYQRFNPEIMLQGHFISGPTTSFVLGTLWGLGVSAVRLRTIKDWSILLRAPIIGLGSAAITALILADQDYVQTANFDRTNTLENIAFKLSRNIPLKLTAVWAIGAVAPFSFVPAVVYPVMEVAFMQGQDPLNDRKYEDFNNKTIE